ncbi:MAG: nucleotide sugar dehydrogenase [Defluviitaleaceae bacterium]|nr:nucleotide sugar dehydrogenase [Defluviitaleaceae bacterium]
MNLYEKLKNRDEKLAVVGLGYVGMPLAVEFAKMLDVIGFDINQAKIESYKNGIDVTGEVGNEALAVTSVHFTYNERNLRDAAFYVVAVPTPISDDKRPNLFPVEESSRVVGRNIKPGSVVVFESTVYPGVTEDVCVPIIEKTSGLVCGKDFWVGYSPERINPGDRVNTLTNIVKVVSGMNTEVLELVAKVYELIIEAGVFRASGIKVAEAVKVVENAQRDVNIAFVNELALVFDRMGIDTNEVVDGMNTKWNALGFRPGLVGGHCIGVDPYYFIYEAERLGYHSQIIQSSRRINDSMSEFVADSTIRQMIYNGVRIKGSNVAVLGFTFKENCPDTRNTKVIDVINGLRNYGVNVYVNDEVADQREIDEHYGLKLINIKEMPKVDCVVLTVAHDGYLQMTQEYLISMFKNNAPIVFIDVKGIFRGKLNVDAYWSL